MSGSEVGVVVGQACGKVRAGQWSVVRVCNQASDSSSGVERGACSVEE
jgi:hypothetical protein